MTDFELMYRNGYEAAKADLLINVLFETCRLSYNEEDLAFDGYTIGEMIKKLYPAKYQQKFEQLKKENKDAE